MELMETIQESFDHLERRDPMGGNNFFRKLKMKRYQTRRDFIKAVGLAAAGFCLSGCGGGILNSRGSKSAKKPNILFILADDFGYGDISCYNSESKVATPNLDKLAGEGILLTDAHSASTVCTPTRYSLMTGRMEFRTGFRGVFTGAEGPCLIEESRLTLPGMLGKQGYETACFGKWHIGLTFLDKDGKRINESGIEGVKRIDYSRPIPDSPVHRGFDHFFGTACCPTTDWLYAFIDGDRIPTPPTKILDRRPLPKHPYSKDNRRGMIAPDFDLEEVDMLFLKKSIEFLQNHKKKSPEKPFFLFHSTQAVHLPSFPGKDFKGKTDAGPHGDFIFELDHIVGELMKALEKHGFSDNTLVMFSSDNGPETTSVINMRKDHHHDGARPWRGMKRDQWEGGHRVPFLARWPGKIRAGTRSDQTVCITDVMATCAAAAGAELPSNAAEDSFNILPILLGKQDKDKPIRRYTLHQTNKLALAIRRGQWKYLDHKGSGGNNYERERLKPFALPDTAPDAPGQLYDLQTDPGETTNLYYKYPEIVKELKTQLDIYRKRGRSAPLR
jgi:arylsulfatase A-like enzyme